MLSSPRSAAASRVRVMLITRKMENRIQVVRVSRSPVPRALMKLDEPPPMPRAPPSDFWIRTTPISAVQTKMLMHSRMMVSMNGDTSLGMERG